MNDSALFQLVGITLAFSLIVLAVRMLASGYAGRADRSARHHTWGNAILVGAISTAIGFGLPRVIDALGVGLSFVAYKGLEVALLAGLFHAVFRTGPVWGALCGLVLGLLTWGVGLVAGAVLGALYAVHPLVGFAASAGLALYPFWRWHKERG